MARMGRPTIYGQKDPKCRYQGLTTTKGGKFMEDARARAAEAAGLKPAQVSDGDLFEYLARIEHVAHERGRVKGVVPRVRT
jgi:hypothetical protein